MKTNLSKIQLNLLLALDALLSECHITRAGKKLFISQSAMSNLLKQLRGILEDPLLVRGAASRMSLTPRAQALKGPVKEALEKAVLVFTPPKPFDPATARRTFIIGMSDYSEWVLLPALVQRITQLAPHIDLVIQHINFLDQANVLSMEQDKLDLAIGIYQTVPPLLLTAELFTDKAVCVGWKENSLFKKPLTLKNYADAQHLLILFAEERQQLFSEQLLMHKGYQRRAVITVPHTLAAIYALPGTQLIATVLERVLNCMGAIKLDLSFQPAPFRYPPPVTSQVWHPKNNDDAAHRWLRKIIGSVAASL